jgi:hypothetical protein
MTYQEKLLDPRWQKKRLEILDRDKWSCRNCGSKEITLHVHHERYADEPWGADNSDLVTYCRDCHFITEFIKKSYSAYHVIAIVRVEKKIFSVIGCDTKDPSLNLILLFGVSKNHNPVFFTEIEPYEATWMDGYSYRTLSDIQNGKI